MRIYKVKTIRALDRGLEVLSVLQTSRSASLHELHVATQLPKATLTRVIATLEARGLIWQRLADSAFLPTHTLLPRPRQINDEAQLVEAASPVLERLCKKVDWPSVLAVPRMDYMEVIETNSPKSYFSHIPLGPIGFKINMLRSATGRCYLGFCGEPERQAILQRLRASSEPGDFLAKRPAMVARLLNETKRLGYGERYQDFGGNFNLSRREWNDGRDSVAVPIVVDFDVVAVINLTWFHKVKTVEQIVAAHLGTLKEAAAEISRRLIVS
jgi:IclR family transcriptional regulator, mhp operon transcriptional activator